MGKTDFHHITERISWTEQLIQDKVEKLADNEIYIFHRVEPRTIIKYITPATDYVFSITRDVRDIMTSRYLLLKYAGATKVDAWHGTKGILSDRAFVNEYAKDSPFSSKGYQFEAAVWKMYNDGYTHANYMLLTYEDLHLTPITQLQNICSLLKIVKTDPELNQIIINNSFFSVTGRDNGEGKPEYFFRKGVVGDYLNYLDQDVIDLVGDAIK